jgi:hypothetical protein
MTIPIKGGIYADIFLGMGKTLAGKFFLRIVLTFYCDYQRQSYLTPCSHT